MKALFQQLQFASGALLSVSIDGSLRPKIEIRESVGIQAAFKHKSEEFCTNISGLSSLNDDTSDHQHFRCSDTRDVTEPCASSTQFYDQTSSSLHTSLAKGDMSNTIMPHDTQSVTVPMHLYNQPESTCQEAHLVFSSPDPRLLKNVLPCESNTTPLSGLSYDRLTSLEDKLLSMSAVRSGELSNNWESTLGNANMCMLPSEGCSSADPAQSSGNISSFAKIKILDPANYIGSLNSFPYDAESFTSQRADLSCIGPPQGLNPAKYSAPTQAFTRDLESSRLSCINKKPLSGSSAKKAKRKNSRFQALECQPTIFDEHGSSCGHLFSYHPESPIQRNRPHKESGCPESEVHLAPTRNINKRNEKTEFLQSLDVKVSQNPQQSASGNDLFDILCLDQYKSRFSCGNLDNINMKGISSPHELSAHVSACITDMEEEPMYNALDDDICYSGMFSEASGDQLLDAVVSQFKPGTKYVDDVASCKTSLTKITNSSVQTSYPTNGRVDSPKQIHAKTFSCPDPLKSEPAASSSMKSSCITERAEGCVTQISGDCKSQIKLWIDGQKLNHDDGSVGHGKKVIEVGKQNKKRCKPGENPRPRPKDRQMIQDRVKELREIVPNGAKVCLKTVSEFCF